jgi:DNA polymerase III epsilon subunit family exonuclease
LNPATQLGSVARKLKSTAGGDGEIVDCWRLRWRTSSPGEIIMIWIVLLLAVVGFAAIRLFNRVNVDHLPHSFVVFDLETTGLDPERHEIIEIGAIRVGRDSTIHESFRRLVKTANAVPMRVTELTGITQSEVNAEGKRLVEVLREFNAFIGELPLVSFNADQDMNFLRNAAQKSAVSIRNPVSCARKMAHRAWPERKSHSLSVLAKDDKADAQTAHSVLDDCGRVLTVYLAAASRLGTAH